MDIDGAEVRVWWDGSGTWFKFAPCLSNGMGPSGFKGHCHRGGDGAVGWWDRSGPQLSTFTPRAA